MSGTTLDKSTVVEATRAAGCTQGVFFVSFFPAMGFEAVDGEVK